MLQNLGNINDFYATLPKEAAIILVIISIIQSLIAGLIPANIASKKDACHPKPRINYHLPSCLTLR
ncbi:MAG: hypothetical protein MR512_00605 [Anaerococcus sp.]|nr:hypothetical protein [Anaerococcus sp.]